MKAPENQNKILESFRQGPNILENALADLSDIDLDFAPSNGGWTMRQIVHHIADGDDLWKTCIKIALGNEQAEFTLQWYQAIPQTTWAKSWNYVNRSIEVSMALLKANRDHIIQLLEYAHDGWSKSVQFLEPGGEIEFISVGAVIQMQSDHVVHHVKQILAIRQEIAST